MNATALLRAQQRYRDDAVLSATPERLVTMLYDRLLLDIQRAEAAQQVANWTEANAQLLHAQAIVTELSASLTDAWDGSDQLRGLYGFLTQTLIKANISRDPQHTRACHELVAPLRDAWHTAADALAGPVGTAGSASPAGTLAESAGARTGTSG